MDGVEHSEPVAGLVCQGVTRAFGRLVAVAGIDLQLAPGATLGIAGANGAGKSTLFNLIAGALAPDVGTITFGGTRIDGMTPDAVCRAGLARTFQTVTNSPRQTVLENVCVAAAYGSHAVGRFHLRLPAAVIDRALEVIAAVGLDGAEAAPAGQLSVFDQRRLMLAAALATEPRLLMLDEPVGGLLPDEIDEIAAILGRVRDEGIALLVIEHVMSFLAQISPDRILIMHQGARLFEGTAAEVSANPAVRAAWLGDVASETSASQRVTC